jgi:hypothetical protein
MMRLCLLIGIVVVVAVTITVRVYLSLTAPVVPIVTAPAVWEQASQTIDTSAAPQGRVLPLGK